MIAEFVSSHASLLANVALLLALTLVSLVVIIRQQLSDRLENLFSAGMGLVFGAAIVLSLSLSFEITDGVVTDLRTLPSLLSGAIAGPIAAVISGVIGMIGRWSMGGSGWISGVLNILIPSLLGWLIWRRSAVTGALVNPFYLIGGIIIAGLAAIPVGLITIPQTRVWGAGVWFNFVGLPTLFNVFTIVTMSIVWHLLQRVMRLNTHLQSSLVRNREVLTQSVEELQARNEQLNITLHASKLGLWTWNPVTNQTRMDNRWYEILGFEPDEFDSSVDNWTARIHPEDLHRCLDLLNKHMAGDTEFYECTYRMQHRNGQWLVIKDTGQVVERDSKGRVSRFVGSHQDISDLIAQTEALKTSTSQLSRVAQVGHIGLFSHNIETGQFDCNEIFRDIFDLPVDQYPVIRLEDLDTRYHPDYADRYAAERFSARQNADQVRVQRILQTSSGETRHVEISCDLYRKQGELKVIAGSVIDQTKAHLQQELLKAAIEEKDKLLRAARVELKRDQLAIELGYGYKWEFDLEKGLLKPDETLAIWSGRGWSAGHWYPAEEILLSIPEKWRAWVGQSMIEQRNSALEDPSSYTMNMQYPIRRADIGKTIWVHAIAKATEIDGVKVMVGQCIDITEAYEQREKLLHQAHHDSVTGLPNRERSLAYLSDTVAENIDQPIGILKIGINQFRHLNNVFGSDFGDQMLTGVKNALENALTLGDNLFRGAGGTFIVVRAVKSQESLQQFALKLLEDLNGTEAFETTHAPEGISIGAYLYESGPIEPERWLQNTQIALSMAKSAPETSFALFNIEMGTRLDRYVRIREELRTALQHSQFELYYQPKVNLRANRVTGCEALIRWNHPERGVVSPAEFIPIAEEAGLIPELTRWILNQACLQMRHWNDKLTNSLSVGVNISARHFDAGTVENDVAVAIKETGIDPNNLELELTESALFESVSGIKGVLERWSKAGIHLSIDDFGTGYSNLSYLADLPINTLKIDQSFIQDFAVNKARRVVVQTTIMMARTLKLETTAEGVEYESTSGALMALGCDNIQGYLISRPLPAEAFEAKFITPQIDTAANAPPPETFVKNSS